MDKIIKDMPNNIVTIICNVKLIDEYHNYYAINPQEVAFGKIDDYGSFVVENTGKKFSSVETFDVEKYNENDQFYLYPITIEELQNKYNVTEGSTELAIAYFKEIRESIYLLYKNKDTNSNIIDAVQKKDDSYVPDLKEKIAVKAPNIIIPKDVSDLSGIVRQDLEDYLKAHIIDNDSVMKDISTIVVSNFRETNPKLIDSILNVGTTGSGKTDTFRLIAKYANLPICEIDCNELTAEGYVGKGMDDILRKIYSSADGNMDKARRAIVFFDEVDKLSLKGDSVKDEDVQNLLLKFLDGYTYDFEVRKNGPKVSLDTSFMTKVAAGAFSELYDKKNKKNPLGFGSSTVEEKDEGKTDKEKDEGITDKEIIEYGLKPEFVGRFRLINEFKTLDREGLYRVLKTSKSSPLLFMHESFLERFGCELLYDDEFLYAIVEEALKTKAGGRSLSKIVAKSFIKLQGAMIDKFDKGDEMPKELKLSREMIANPNSFRL